jgi:hypothetical protein
VLLTSPIDETEGVQGMPEFLFLEQYALDHHLGQIVSQSWGATENTHALRSGWGTSVPIVRALLPACERRTRDLVGPTWGRGMMSDWLERILNRTATRNLVERRADSHQRIRAATRTHHGHIHGER